MEQHEWTGLGADLSGPTLDQNCPIQTGFQPDKLDKTGNEQKAGSHLQIQMDFEEETGNWCQSESSEL